MTHGAVLRGWELFFVLEPTGAAVDLLRGYHSGIWYSFEFHPGRQGNVRVRTRLCDVGGPRPPPFFGGPTTPLPQPSAVPPNVED